MHCPASDIRLDLGYGQEVLKRTGRPAIVTAEPAQARRNCERWMPGSQGSIFLDGQPWARASVAEGP